MALFAAQKGQTAKVPLTIQFTKGDGAATDPTGTPNLRVYYADPAGSLTLKVTLNPTKQASLTGFYGSFLDISNITTYPAGKYVLRWDATVDGIATATEDFLQLDDAASIPGTGAVGAAYCSESEIRNWAQPMESVAIISSALIAEKAAQGSDYIDSRLRVKYTVPFAGPPYDELVVLLNIWLAVAYLLEDREAQAGNSSELRTDLLERANENIDLILNGNIVLSVTARSTLPDVLQSSSESSTRGATRLYDWDLDNPDSSAIGRF